MTALFNILQRIFRREGIRVGIFRVLGLALTLNFIFGTAFYFAERDVQEGLEYTDALWWAMVSMTTVGYGDYYAQTALGRFIISYPCMLIGIGIIGYLVGILAESMLERISNRRRGLMQIEEKGHILICNCPSTERVLQIVDELKAHTEYAERVFVLITAAFDELPALLAKDGLLFVKGSPTQEDILMQANVAHCGGVFILATNPGNADSDAQTFAVGTIVEMIAREQNRPIQVVAEMVSKKNIKMMQRAGTDGIVAPEGISDCMLVQEFLYPGTYEVFQQLMSNAIGSQFYIFDTQLEGVHLSDIQVAVLRHPANMQLIGIVRNNTPHLNPPETMKLQADDRVIMLAESKEDFKTMERDLLQAQTAQASATN